MLHTVFYIDGTKQAPPATRSLAQPCRFRAHPGLGMATREMAMGNGASKHCGDHGAGVVESGEMGWCISCNDAGVSEIDRSGKGCTFK